MKQAVCVLIQHEGRILAIDRFKKSGVVGDYGFPGGKVEPGEELKDAALRETREETGLHLNGLETVYEGNDGHCLVTTFKTGTWWGTVSSSEEGEVLWVRPEELISEACTYRQYNTAVFKTVGLLKE